MGQEASNTHVISNITQLQKLHHNAILYAVERKKQLLKDTGRNELTDEEQEEIDQEIQLMMRKNGI